MKTAKVTFVASVYLPAENLEQALETFDNTELFNTDIVTSFGFVKSVEDAETNEVIADY